MKPKTNLVFSLASLLGLAMLVILLGLAPSPTPYDYFSRLAKAFAQGRLYLTDSPAWLSELIPAEDNRYYVPYPPMPALLLTPFALLNIPLNQTLLANLLGSLNVSLSFIFTILLVKNHPGYSRRKTELAVLMALLLGLGTPHFFLASVGSAWYLSHVVATTFLFLAAIGAFSNHALLSGLFLGAAYWSRLPTILTAPLLLILLIKGKSLVSKKKKGGKDHWFTLSWRFLLAAGVFVFLNSLYNLARFDVPWDIGYLLIPNVLAEPWFQQGIFHPSYFKRHLRIIFLSLPKRTPVFPYLRPSWEGMAIWITTPAVVFTLLAKPTTLLALISWVTLILTILPSFLHGTTGFAQFGYRFAMDAILPLFLLVYLGVSRSPRFLAWLLVIVGAVVNLWGTYLINHLGLVDW